MRRKSLPTKKAAAKKPDPASKPNAKDKDPKKHGPKESGSEEGPAAKNDQAKKDVASGRRERSAPKRPASRTQAGLQEGCRQEGCRQEGQREEGVALSADKAAVPLPKMRPGRKASTAGVRLSDADRIAAFGCAFARRPRHRLMRPLLASVDPQQLIPVVLAPAEAPSSDNLAAVKKAIDLARRGRGNEATAIANAVTDPVAAKLIEWMVLRSENGDFDFQRYAGFAAANPGWPNITQFRRKAEAALWQNGVNDTVVRRYFATTKPLTAKGKLALARALIAQGDRTTAQQLVRDAWRTDPLTSDMESADPRRLRAASDRAATTRREWIVASMPRIPRLRFAPRRSSAPRRSRS